MKKFIVNKSLIITVFCSLLFSGCSSNPASQSQYYLLNNQQAVGEINESDSSEKQILLLKIKELPRYLNQANLVLQRDQHQLHYAHHHMWAEPLHTGFSKALFADLNNNSKNKVFIESSAEANLEKLTALVIKVNHFHPTYQSKVILTGQYWLSTTGDNNSLPTKKNFHLEVDLQQDGYGHSVEKMRELIQLFSTQVLTKM